MVTSLEYWANREAENLRRNLKQEKEYERELDRIYGDMLDGCQKEIESFYSRYADVEGISIAEAKKRVSQLDIEIYERKAKRYVRDAARDRKQNGGKTNTSGHYFSKKANNEMRLYNLTMKVNRLEMLKANIGLDLIKGHAELETFMGNILQGRTEAELKRQAGILGKTIKDNAKAANAIVNSSFHNATFSDRVWMYHGKMKADLSKLLESGMIQGKGARELARDLRKYYIGDPKLKNGKNGAKYAAERLMRTELARVQTEAQKQSFVKNGFTEYTFIVNGNCCGMCRTIAGKHFKVDKMMPGENAPPMHPLCRCSTAAYEDSDEYEAWLDYLSKGGTTAEWDKIKNEQLYRKVIRGNDAKFNVTSENAIKQIDARRISTYSEEVYVSNKADIKPRALHAIVNNIKTALKNYGIPDKRTPKIVILDEKEMPTAFGKYDAIHNIAYFIPEITDRNVMDENLKTTEYHEMWHMKQAEDFRNKGWEITEENYNKYITELCKKCKRKIDSLGINKYNVGDISEYAKKMYFFGRYDEVEAECITKHRKGN